MAGSETSWSCQGKKRSGFLHRRGAAVNIARMRKNSHMYHKARQQENLNWSKKGIKLETKRVNGGREVLSRGGS